MLLNLTGKKILVTGIANNRSIAWGIAQQLSKAGAELGITYLPDDKGRFESKVRELTEQLNPSLFLPLDVQNPAQIEEIFKKAEFCSMCGPKHCPMNSKISDESLDQLKDKLEGCNTSV